MKYLISLFLVIAGLNLQAQPILPATPIKTNSPVTLAWDASPTTNVTHYFLRRGNRSGQYVDMMRVDGRLTLTAVWTNIAPGSTNYFIATAATDAMESDPSNELQYIAPSKPVGIPLRSAVPLQARFEWQRKDGTWEEIKVDFGPYYVLTDDTNSMFRVKAFVGSSVPILPR